MQTPRKARCTILRDGKDGSLHYIVEREKMKSEQRSPAVVPQPDITPMARTVGGRTSWTAEL
jgi:hypothetical protein